MGGGLAGTNAGDGWGTEGTLGGGSEPSSKDRCRRVKGSDGNGTGGQVGGGVGACTTRKPPSRRGLWPSP